MPLRFDGRGSDEGRQRAARNGPFQPEPSRRILQWLGRVLVFSNVSALSSVLVTSALR